MRNISIRKDLFELTLLFIFFLFLSGNNAPVCNSQQNDLPEEIKQEQDDFLPVPEDGTYIGLYNENPAIDAKELYDRFIEKAGKKPIIHLAYNNFDFEATKNLLGNSSYMLIKVPAVLPKLLSQNCGKSANCESDWDDSETIAYGKELLEKLHNVKGLLAYGWEMNGCWYDWGCKPAEYIRSFRIIADMVHSSNLKIKMAWNPNYTDSSLKGKIWSGKSDYLKYYPGDRYVDWALLDIYDWETYGFFRSHEPEVLLKPFADFMAKTAKPFGIGEFSWCRNRNDVKSGTVDQRIWLDKFHKADKKLGYKMIVYFDVVKEDGDGDSQFEDFRLPDYLFEFLEDDYFIGQEMVEVESL